MTGWLWKAWREHHPELAAAPPRSACADVVIVVEARAEGGAVHTAKCALKEDRPVLVVDWSREHPGEGNRQLLAEGGRVLQVGEDVVAAVREAVRGACGGHPAA